MKPFSMLIENEMNRGIEKYMIGGADHCFCDQISLHTRSIDGDLSNNYCIACIRCHVIFWVMTPFRLMALHHLLPGVKRDLRVTPDETEYIQSTSLPKNLEVVVK